MVRETLEGALLLAGSSLHLALPLTASLMFAFGALFVKRATSSGVSVWTVTFATNMVASAVFSCLWTSEGRVPWPLLWQPAVIASLYIAGQIAILSAVTRGDVSVAMPVASIKAVVVAGLLAVWTGDAPSWETWTAVLLSTLGVALIHYAAPSSHRGSVLATALLALLGAATYAVFDVLVQEWTSAADPDGGSVGWTTRKLLPCIYWFVALFSLTLLPWVELRPSRLRKQPWRSMLLGALLVGAQALLIVFALSRYGDAARVNVVYSMRGFWAVVLAWMLAGWFHGAEASLPRRTMVTRLAGALLLIAGVVLTFLTP